MNSHAAEPPSFSIADILRGMARRKVLVLGFLVLGLLGGLAIVSAIRPLYQSEARVLVDNLATPFDKANNVPDQRRDQIDDRIVLSQVSVLGSADLALRVIDSLQLSGTGEFEPLANGIGKLSALLIALGFSDDPRLMTPEQRALSRLAKKVTVYQVPQSNVIAIKYAALDGKTAAAVANRLAEIYVLSTRETESGATARARDWLSGQISELRLKVSAAEVAVEKFRSEAGLFKGQTATLGAQEISELNSQITIAEAASSEAEARASEIRDTLENKGSVDASSDVMASPVIQRLRELQVAAGNKVSELSATYLPNHPKMLAAQREAEGVEKQIRREALKIVDGLRGQANVAAARAQSLRDSLETLKDREGGAAQSDVRLKELEREALANRALLETMLARFADANARQDLDLQPGLARVIQKASAPSSPYFPKPGPTVLLATCAGLGLGLGLSFLLEIRAQAARLNDAAMVRFQQPAHAHVARAIDRHDANIPDLAPDVAAAAALDALKLRQPPPQQSPPQVIASLPATSSLAEAFAALADTAYVGNAHEPIARIAAALAEQQKSRGTRVFCFTSVGGTQDAAFACAAVSRALAAAGVKMLVVDANPQRPSVTDLMSLPTGPGLAELVAGTTDVTRVIQRDPHSNVQLIRFGLHSDEPSKSAVSARMEAILAALATIYEIILVHAGEASPATPALAKGAGAAVFFATPARQRDAAAAAATLAQKGIPTSLFVKLEPSLADTGAARMAG